MGIGVALWPLRQLANHLNFLAPVHEGTLGYLALPVVVPRPLGDQDSLLIKPELDVVSGRHVEGSGESTGYTQWRAVHRWHGRARYMPGYAPSFIICQLIGFYT